MTAEVFLDTNIIVYAVDRSPASAAKNKRARQIIREGKFGVSAQVVQEFYVVSTRKLKKPLSPALAIKWVDRLCRAEFTPLDAAIIKTGIANAKRYQISYWDGAILAAAEALGAPVVFTEDLNHGQSYGAVKVVNPFLPV